LVESPFKFFLGGTPLSEDAPVLGERLLCFGIGLPMPQPSRFAPPQVFQAGTRSRDARDPNGISGRPFLEDLLAIVGKLLAKQDGGVLREGIQALSEALMEMEV
jgi:hypothetical protein